MLNHLKFSVFDWILCSLASIALSLNVVQSFLLPEALSRDVLRIAVISAVIIALLIVLSYNKLSSILSVVLVMAGIVLVLFLAYMGVIEGFVESEDPEENGRLWYLVVVICAILVYLCSRTQISSWVLLIVGMIAAAYFYLLEYRVYIWAALLFVFSMGAWICFVNYRKNMLKISAMRTAFLPMAGWASAVSLICLALGCLLWWGIIRPIQPPTQELLLITDYLEFSNIQRLGLINENELFDFTQYSDWLNDRLTEETNELEQMGTADEDNSGDTQESHGTEQEAEGTQTEEHNEDFESEESPNSEENDGSIDWVSHNSLPRSVIAPLIILLVLLVAALVVLFIRRRAIWYYFKTKDMDDAAYIRFFFPWYLKRFRKMKLPKPQGDTPMEYAKRTETSTRFLDDTGVTWQEMSEIFSRLVYGGRDPLPEDRKKYEQFYRGFYRCCRKKLHFAWILYGLRL